MDDALKRTLERLSEENLRKMKHECLDKATIGRIVAGGDNYPEVRDRKRLSWQGGKKRRDRGVRSE